MLVLFVALSATVTAAAQTTTVTGSSSTSSVPRAGDDASTRTVNRIVGALAGFAVVLIGVAIWFWRATRPVPRYLDALDALGSRRWQRASPQERATLLAPIHERRGDPREAIAEPDEPDETAVPRVS